MKQIPLTQGKFALVDDTNFDWLNQWHWHANKFEQTYYAARNIRKGKDNYCVFMHREILGLKRGDDVESDHRNGNGLDNRRQNIRRCTIAENQHNQRPRIGCSSKFKGVHWHKNYNKWQSLIRCCKDKRVYLGRFDNEIDAAKAYDKAAKKYFGEFARTNFEKINYADDANLLSA